MPLPPTYPRHPLDLPGALHDVLGLVLWKRVRAVKLWGATPEGRRAGLFVATESQVRDQLAHAVAQAPELDGPLSVLAAMVRFPERALPAEIAAACLQVAGWADRKGMTETALQFAEAGAIAHPTDPQAAAVAGEFCTRAAAPDRATAWLQRAIVLARRTKNREWYVRSHLRLGYQMFNLAEYAEAQRLYLRAFRMAARKGRRGLAGQAQHHLFTIACEVGTFQEGEEHARKALETYPVRHPRVPYLAHDYAWLLNREHFFSSARPLLEAALPHIPPRQQLFIKGSLARAYAGIGDLAAYEGAAGDVLRLASASEEGAAAALLHVADGARCFGEWDRAAAIGGHALEVALRREEREVQRVARGLLDQVGAREPGPTDLKPPASSQVRVLVPRFLARLRKWSAPAERAGAAEAEDVAGRAGSDQQGTTMDPEEPVLPVSERTRHSASDAEPAVVPSDFPPPPYSPPL